MSTPATDQPAAPAATAGQPALVVAHPGHEMRLHAWLERTKPRVFVLTDGSGHGEDGRLASTAEVIARAGARQGSIFGRFTDRQAYRLIAESRIDVLEALVSELADALDASQVDTVVSDAVEGFNPVHDLCFLLVEAAIQRLNPHRAEAIRHFDFWLEAAPDTPTDRPRSPLRLHLSEEEFERKLHSARSYAAMRDEVERLIAAHSSEAFRVESLHPVDPATRWLDRIPDKPFYETHGERRVAEGVYREVVRFRQHFLPLTRALGRREPSE